MTDPIAFGNEQAFQQSLQIYSAFVHATRATYQKNERGYKLEMLAAWKAAMDFSNPTFLVMLIATVKKYQKSLTNLTHFIDSSNLLKYLQAVEADRFARLLQALYRPGDLVDRIDQFKKEVDGDYKKFGASGAHINLGIISILLAAQSPQDYCIYRASPLTHVCEIWDWPIPNGTPGERYVAHLKLTQMVKERLKTSYDPQADLIDVNSFLWIIYPKSGYAELIDQVLHGKDSSAAEVEPAVLPAPLRSLLNKAKQTRNLILYGPPGTGKTWLVNHFANYFLLQRNFSTFAAENYWRAVMDKEPSAYRDLADKVRPEAGTPAKPCYGEFVTFHQSFAYEEFVEGLKPQVVGETKQLTYDIEDGIFKRMCTKALNDPRHTYLLVIDEINRANIAKVFGELITLIEDDKRLGQPNAVTVRLPYSGSAAPRFGVPKNLYILGTMNTADRSIALLDIALRRRFAFVELMPDPEPLAGHVVDNVDLEALLTTINQRIEALLDRDHQIGHSYFLNISTADELMFAWYTRIVPLLQEYFYNDGTRLQAIIGDDFVKQVPADAGLKKALKELYDSETPRYEVEELDGDDFLSALQKLCGD